MKTLRAFFGTAALICASASAFAYDDVTPVDAYNLATTQPDTYILDVRTESEWRWVGHPGANKLGEGAALDGKVVNVSYKIFNASSFVLNPSFLSDVEGIFGSNPNAVLITMCRSGTRSAAAAAALEAAGYQVKNMVTGFEGSSDMYGYRTINGWANNGLPYSYSTIDGYAD